jgi:hypothetical protein
MRYRPWPIYRAELIRRERDMDFIKIPTSIQTVPQGACDRLLEKQFYARVWMNQNPFANAMRAKLKVYLRNFHRDNVVELR